LSRAWCSASTSSEKRSSKAQGTDFRVALLGLPRFGHVAEAHLVEFFDGWFK
jgi:hypothetical protein